MRASVAVETPVPPLSMTPIISVYAAVPQDDGVQWTYQVSPDLIAHPVHERVPPSIMIDVDGDSALITSPYHPVGVLKGCGQGLLAKNPLHARTGAVDHDVGVLVVWGNDSQDVQVLSRQHLPIVGVCVGVR